jgi:hypothetical protein
VTKILSSYSNDGREGAEGGNSSQINENFSKMFFNIIKLKNDIYKCSFE